MNYKMVGRFIAQILAIETVFMIPPMLIAFWDHTILSAKGFGCSMTLMIILAAILFFFCRGAKSRFGAKDGLVCVGISWIVLSIFGCLPFVISGEIPDFIDALFEIVSGFTTTGASILPEVESHSRAILYWRSFSHWLGGMGVLVFLLAVSGGEKGSGFTMHLLRAESPGPSVGKLVSKMKQTASILYVLYMVLTVLDIIFLLFGGMDLFEACCTAFGTAGTGGFGIKNDSIASYSPYIQNVCTVFMLLFGVNFTCYYLLLLRQFKAVFKDEELRTYILLVVASIAIIALNIRGLYPTLEETVRHAAFQVATIVTTTGYATADFDLWPGLSKAILLCLMFCGACAGSTGGGFKVGRLMLMVKNLRRNIHKVLHPNKIQKVRNNGTVVSENVLESTNDYMAAYVIIIFFSFLVVAIDGHSLMTSFSAVVACFNNIGPGFEMVGPTCNYGFFSPLSKLVLIADMLAGRLEIFPILILASRSTWTRK
ncbi:MAG: TrkH family potassium uptake protein [Clostridia bacterium]|nr:TrkH family potassium uptake protein [Clostridia bacterium]